VGHATVDLPGGLLLRDALASDRDALGELLAAVHAGPDGTPNASVGRWQRDLFDRGHPTVRGADMLVVEDRDSGALVSSLMMVPQTWSFGGVPIPISLIELAATDPRYRGQQLHKRQLLALFARSDARGDLLQGATDVLYHGDDVGLQSAITQRAGRGGRLGDLPSAPVAAEPVRLRTAELRDVDTLSELERLVRERVLLACIRDDAQWRHELDGRSPDSMVHDELVMIEGPAGPVGYAVVGYGGIPSFPIPSWLPGLPCPEPVVSVARFELFPGASWLDVTPSVVRQLTASRGAAGYMLWLGRQHPAYDALGDLLVRRPPEMGWFLRVPDMVALLRRIATVLEGRLRNNAGEAFTGELRLHLYRDGIHLRFSDGALATVERWSDHSRRGSDASLPSRMLLQLVLGQASWDELAPAFPDCRLQTNAGRALLPLLFPKLPSSVWPLI
jgi:hypothetical protein